MYIYIYIYIYSYIYPLVFCPPHPPHLFSFFCPWSYPPHSFLPFFLHTHRCTHTHTAAHMQIHTYVYTYSCMSNIYTHSLPAIPPSSSQPGIFHSATPKCVLFYILCKFVPVCPSALPSFYHLFFLYFPSFLSYHPYFLRPFLIKCPLLPLLSSQPGIFHSVTPKFVLFYFYILCMIRPLYKFDTFFMTVR